MSLRLLPSMKQASVAMKTKAKKASSDSENIQSAYFVIDMSKFLYLQSTPTCDTLISGFVPYVVVKCSQRPNLQTWLLLFNGLRNHRSSFPYGCAPIITYSHYYYCGYCFHYCFFRSLVVFMPNITANHAITYTCNSCIIRRCHANVYNTV